MKQIMDLNKEIANQLWVQQFGKKQKAIDYTGREVAKAAYNDRNSKYGWNVDHILPLSRGGKTADHNLICCHILTNDEKANKFPCFKANAKEFEIKKRQNYYEIEAKTDYPKKEEEELINFQDVAQGLKCWKQCKANSKGVFAGYVKIRVETSNKSDQLLERYRNFLVELFGTDSIFAEEIRTPYVIGYNRSFVFTVIMGDVTAKEDMENILDDCIILNTYSTYFIEKTGFEDIKIVCGMECYDNYLEMSLNCKKDILENQVRFIASLAIDKLVKINTTAEKELKNTISPNGFYPYDFYFTKLRKNLEKLIR